MAELTLTPLDLIDRIAALVPPRTHRHRYFGVLVPNSLLRAAVTAFAPLTSPRRAGPPLWDECDAQMGEGVEIVPDWDLAAQPAPDFDAGQRINWCQVKAAIRTRCGVALRLGLPVAPEITLKDRAFGAKPAKQGSKSRVFTQFESCFTVRNFASCG